MGIFNKNKKEDKVYSLREAMNLLKKAKYDHYTTIPEGDGYRLVPIGQEVQYVENGTNCIQRRSSFLDRISDNGSYRNNKKVQNTYNNYQSAKRYKGNTSYASYR